MLYHVISTIDYHELLCSIPLILFQSIASYRLRHLRWHASEGSGAWKAPLPGGPKGAKKQRRPGRHIGSLGELPRSRLLDELNTIIFIFVFFIISHICFLYLLVCSQLVASCQELFRIFLKHDLDFYEVVHKAFDMTDSNRVFQQLRWEVFLAAKYYSIFSQKRS